MLFVGHDIETRAIELTLTSTPLPVVMGDRVQLQQVIVNLLVNSIQAIPNAGKIFVETELRPDTTVSLTIYDNGPGIPEEASSEERRVGNACVSTCRFGWSP